MRKLLPFLLLAFSSAGYAQSKQHLISSSTYDYSSNPPIIRQDSSHHIYNNQKPAYINMLHGWNSDTIYNYDVNGQITTRETKIFDANGRVSELHNDDALSTGGWGKGLRCIYTYDAADNLIKLEAGHYGSGQFRIYNKHTYTYNSNNQKLSELLEEWNVVRLQFDTISRDTYIYTGGKLSEMLGEYMSGNWTPAARTTYTYPTATEIEEIYELHSGSVWEIQSKTVKTLNAGQKLVSATRKYYNAGNWEEHSQRLFTYNSDNNIIAEEEKVWNGSSYTIQKGYYYYYGFPTGISETKPEKNAIAVYPIPASNSLHINMAATDGYHAYLYDATGRLAKTVSATGLCTVNVQDLPAGNYVLHVQTGGNVATQKVAIAR